MIYTPQTGPVSAPSPARTSPVQGRFSMESGRNDRMGGSVPVYGAQADKAHSSSKTSSFGEDFARSLENQVKNSPLPAPPSSALALQPTEEAVENPSSPAFGFLDFLDIINPLQHIPIVSTIYRHITGDEIGAVANIAGGALFGGPIGAAAGAVSAIVTHETGKEPASALIDFVSGDDFEGTTIAVADLTKTRTDYNS